MMTILPVLFQLTVIHPTMPDAVKEMDLEVSKSDVHNTAKDSHRQVMGHSNNTSHFYGIFSLSFTDFYAYVICFELQNE
jgi:hypothetical protein